VKPLLVLVVGRSKSRGEDQWPWLSLYTLNCSLWMGSVEGKTPPSSWRLLNSMLIFSLKGFHINIPHLGKCLLDKKGKNVLSMF
jgi:hypothetical protein